MTYFDKSLLLITCSCITEQICPLKRSFRANLPRAHRRRKLPQAKAGSLKCPKYPEAQYVLSFCALRFSAPFRTDKRGERQWARIEFSALQRILAFSSAGFLVGPSPRQRPSPLTVHSMLRTQTLATGSARPPPGTAPARCAPPSKRPTPYPVLTKSFCRQTLMF